VPELRLPQHKAEEKALLEWLGMKLALKGFLYILTFAVGSIISYYFVNPLAFLVYLFLWTDSVVLYHFVTAQKIGFELITVASIISGIALGPLGGIIFSVIGVPAIATALYVIVFRDDHPLFPNIDFVVAGMSAALAGYLFSGFSFLTAVFAAVFFKHLVMNLINRTMGSDITYGESFFNILFTFAFMLFIERIGLLAAVL
jgi:hypothetical protein